MLAERAAQGPHEVTIDARQIRLAGELDVPNGAEAIIVFAHGSGSSRKSPRNRRVAHALREAGLGTLVFDLLSPEEEWAERMTRNLRFDIALLARRTVLATEWLRGQPIAHDKRLGFFGASTGAAAAIVAAAELGPTVGAIVSRGGRPDLAGAALARIRQPTLLLVGGDDLEVMALNRLACEQIHSEKKLVSIPGASHLFEEPGTLELVWALAADWFAQHLLPPESKRRPVPGTPNA